MFIGTQVDTMSCKGADSVCCPLSCAFSLFLLCGKLEYLAQGRRNVRLRLALFHRAVHRADVAVHDADALVGAAGVFLRPLAYLDPLDEQPQQLRRQLVDGGVLLRLLNECVHVGGGSFQLFQQGLLFEDLFLQRFLFDGVIARQHPVLLIGHPPQHIVLIEPLEQLGQLLSAPPHGTGGVLTCGDVVVIFVRG